MALDDRPEDVNDTSLLRLAPELTRLGVLTSMRAVGWGARAYLRVGARVIEGVQSGESPGELLQNGGAELAGYARRVLGLHDHDPAAAPPAQRGPGRAEAPAQRGHGRSEAPAQRGPGRAEAPAQRGHGRSPEAPVDSIAALRRRGADLLARSADVGDDEQTHPAYARILGELAPDEARILRYMAKAGPQAAVDVRTNRLPLNVGSQLVSPGLTMIGAEAGLRHVEQLPAYLNNLFRLGLIWFSREPLPDPLGYQVLEAQPDVIDALRKEGRAKTIRRSILLTPFGADFCRVCLPA